MDLWDLTKLLLRRWYVALPLLLSSVAMIVLTAQGVSPDYKAVGHLQMIPPPSLGKPVDPKAPVRPSNPWLDLGYQALGNAALLKVTDPSVLGQMAGKGLAESVTVTLDIRLPVLEIEAIGDSPEQATATVREVLKLLANDVASAQKQYGVLAEDTITTLVLSDGANVEVVSSKVKRALVVTAGVGLLFTTAGTIGIDAWLRRWSRRRMGLEPAGSEPPPTNGHRRADMNDDAAVRVFSVLSKPRTPAEPRTTILPTRPTAPPPAETQPVERKPVGRTPVEAPEVEAKPVGRKPVAAKAGESPLTLEYKHPGERPEPREQRKAPEPAPDETSETTVLAADATIVLPLPPGSGWPWRDGGKNGR